MLKLVIPIVVISTLLAVSESMKTGVLAITRLFLLSVIASAIIYRDGANPLIDTTRFIHDIISGGLVTLTLWIAGLIILARIHSVLAKNIRPKIFTLTVLRLTFILILAFMAESALSFYILFEASLIPTLFVVINWGTQPERLQARYYLIIYTVTASLPFLILILFIFTQQGHLSFTSLAWENSIPRGLMTVAALSISVAFLVKVPMYTVHLWLPKAHVEAPVAGRIVLAAILLKLGGYGLLRIDMVNPLLTYSLTPYIAALAL